MAKTVSLQSRLTVPVIVLSVLGAIAFAILSVRERNRVYTLTLATGSASGQYYAFGQAFAKVVANHEPNIEIKVLETDGSQQNMRRVGDQLVDLAIVQSDTRAALDARAIALLFPEMFHVMAVKDGDVNSIADLRGRRIAVMPEGSGSYALFWPLINHYGLGATDFEAVPLPPDEAMAALRSRQVDALFRVIALGNDNIANALRSDDIKLLPIDQVEALQLTLPFVEATTIPKGAYDGGLPMPAEDLPVVAVNALLVANENLDPKLVSTLTRVLFDFRTELVNEYAGAAIIRLPESAQNLGMPVHPGAQAFYQQDQPSFWVEYAETIGLGLSVAILMTSGLWQFRIWLIGRQKNRADMYNLEILALINQVEAARSLTELTALRQQLFKILQEVVVDLDIDRISPESFQSFTFPWEVAITTIRHREMMLTRERSVTPRPRDAR
ncbi:MAG: TAXI family TRAP transporter solute-binding subunit [Cyanobacteria bacterium P01_H01_bin.119]